MIDIIIIYNTLNNLVICFAHQICSKQLFCSSSTRITFDICTTNHQSQNTDGRLCGNETETNQHKPLPCKKPINPRVHPWAFSIGWLQGIFLAPRHAHTNIKIISYTYYDTS